MRRIIHQTWVDIRQRALNIISISKGDSVMEKTEEPKKTRSSGLFMLIGSALSVTVALINDRPLQWVLLAGAIAMFAYAGIIAIREKKSKV